MNKRVLIISPYFPPSNAADMQRVRMSLPYFKDFGWDAEVVVVNSKYSDIVKDELLLQSVPDDIKIYQVDALDKKWTSKIGVGSIALRSLWFYRKTVNKLLRQKHYDLVYFSTTSFPVLILGSYWKKKFGIPYVIDMQDPWHSDYYKDKPKNQRPTKYWFSYRLNKYLEPIAMQSVDGLIAVSENYITDLKTRYPQIKNIPSATIPFGAYANDMETALLNNSKFKNILKSDHINLVYIGRGGMDMHRAIGILFEAVKSGLTTAPEIFSALRLYFIGTSYAPQGEGKETIMPLAKQFGITDHVIEITDRMSFYYTLMTLQSADALFIPGSDDPKYTASKIYPYILTRKPLVAIFNPQSPAIDILNEYGVKNVFSYTDRNVNHKISQFLRNIVTQKTTGQVYNEETVEKYSAKSMTNKQCILFNLVTA